MSKVRRSNFTVKDLRTVQQDDNNQLDDGDERDNRRPAQPFQSTFQRGDPEDNHDDDIMPQNDNNNNQQDDGDEGQLGDDGDEGDNHGRAQVFRLTVGRGDGAQAFRRGNAEEDNEPDPE
jgi:hypothetical protein